MSGEKRTANPVLRRWQCASDVSEIDFLVEFAEIFNQA